MAAARSECPRDRDQVIALASYGKITPDEAEHFARSNGWKPFEQRPEFPKFDVMQCTTWSLVMALAWIAWRDVDLVREQNADFRAECTHWVFKPWREFAAGSDKSIEHTGWFVEPWSKTSVIRLSMLEISLRDRQQFPRTCQMTIAEAKEWFWSACSEGAVVVQALDHNGHPVEIPKLEWTYLSFFEERERDVLKREPLSVAAYREMRIRRDDLLKCWPPIEYEQAEFRGDSEIDALMISPVAATSPEAFVPLCSALHWIMTGGGVREIKLDDDAAWQDATQKLLACLHREEIALIGCALGSGQTEKIPGYALALVRVLAPTARSIQAVFQEDCAQIACCPFMGDAEWRSQFNDKLYDLRQSRPAWTHLQVRKDQLLDRWPRPTSKVKREQDCVQWLVEEMRKSQAIRPKNKGEFRKDAKTRFKGLADRQFNRCWEKAMQKSGAFAWSKHGPTSKDQITTAK